MPRKPSAGTKWCKYCEKDQRSRGFDRHVISCQRNALIAQDSREWKRSQQGGRAAQRRVDDGITVHTSNEIERGSTTLDSDPTCPYNNTSEPQHSDLYIEIEYHPQSGIPKKIIRLDATKPESFSSTNSALVSSSQLCLNTQNSPTSCMAPWAPFRTRPDFEYAESVVRGRIPKDTVDAQLHGFHSSWAQHTEITFQNYSHLMKSIDKAKESTVRFQPATFTLEYQGKTQSFNFSFRDPWEWLVDLVTDPTLKDSINWFPVRKYLHDGSKCTQMYDEPETAAEWWSVQDHLPSDSAYPHCFLPIIVWLDKGNVTKKVKVHPVLARAAFLHSNIRNASGNGGGVLLGYVPMVKDDGDSNDREEFSRFKKMVYHGILRIMFASLVDPAKFGECLACADAITRILHPAIPIASLDGEEACMYACCRAASAAYPCPRCLVHHDFLDQITVCFTPRTSSSMQAIYHRAMNALTETAKNEVLAQAGLHDTPNFFWSLEYSSPYEAISYDTLHADDIGKWGKHLWPLLCGELERSKRQKALNQNMRNVPRWPALKHFSAVTKLDYADGTDYLHVLKCILPCIVQLLPRQSPLVHCIRSYAKYRMMLDLHCITEEQISRLQSYIKDYERYCKVIAEEYGKSFRFPKQHAITHVIADIRNKGATHNYSTPPGESFQQEAQEAYERTNGKNIDPQMVRIDEDQETVAHIRLAVNAADQLKEQDLESAIEARQHSKQDQAMHWSLGGGLRHWSPCSEVEASYCNDRRFVQLRKRLNEFLHYHVDPSIDDGMETQLRLYSCLYLRFVSLDDWTEKSDILRCSPSFHGTPRHDCAVINMDSKHFTFARLHLLFTCRLPFGDEHDVAVVTKLKRRSMSSSKWKPNTVWDGCTVYEEEKTTSLVFVKYLTRAAHLISFNDLRQPSAYCLNDLIDTDWFLRAGN